MGYTINGKDIEFLTGLNGLTEKLNNDQFREFVRIML